VGFIPKRSRVWFTKNLAYAKRRAKTQATRAKDQAIALRCDLDLGQLRNQHGSKSVMVRSHVVAIRGRVPSTVLTDQSGETDFPYVFTAEYLAGWINGILRVKPHKGVSRRHAGVKRLEQWIRKRLSDNPKAQFKPSELLVLARQWMPEVLSQYKIDPKTLRATRLPPPEEEPEWEGSPAPAEEAGPDEALILEDLTSSRPSRRVKGLRMLADADEPELFEWCMMYLDDASADVRVAVLETARQSEDPEPEMIATFAEDEDRRIRGAAISFMTKHGDDREEWFRMGLTDPETHVRVVTARHLDELDPAVHKKLFELALYDPNPKVVEVARKMTVGKGYAERW
jgi:hypothetical protein